MDDVVAVRGLRLAGRHGVFDEERAREQEFVVDVECGVDVSAAARSDALEDAFDYRLIEATARAVIGGGPRRLIETLAVSIADRLLAAGRARWVRVRVTKLSPSGLGAPASVEIVRPSEDGPAVH